MSKKNKRSYKGTPFYPSWQRASLHCLLENDLESFQDVLVAHLRTVSKSKLAVETQLGRRTLYDLLDESEPFNPTLSTLGPILKSLAA